MLINLTNGISGYFLIYFEISVCLTPNLVIFPAFALLPYHACFQLATGLSIYSSSFALTTCHLVNLLSQASQHSSWFCYFPLWTSHFLLDSSMDFAFCLHPPKLDFTLPMCISSWFLHYDLASMNPDATLFAGEFYDFIIYSNLSSWWIEESS